MDLGVGLSAGCPAFHLELISLRIMVAACPYFHICDLSSLAVFAVRLVRENSIGIQNITDIPSLCTPNASGLCEPVTVVADDRHPAILNRSYQGQGQG